MMNEWIISSCVLIGLVLLGRFLLRGKISLRLQYGLWAVVLLRLLVPFQVFTSDYGTGSIARDVDIAAPVRQVYVSVSQEHYQREYDAAYRQAAAEYETADLGDVPLNPVVLEETAREVAETRLELDLTKILHHLWMTGMGVMSLVIIGCNLHLSLRLRKRRWAMAVPDCPLSVYVTSVVPTPCIFGLLRPAIYLTPNAVKDPQVRAHVIEHELTHYRHLDHIWSVLRSLCLVLHWYNPLVWIAAKVSRADAELACDEGALTRLGESQRGDYGRTLIGLTCADPISDLLITATTMTGSAASLRERIRLLMKRPRNTALTLTAVILMVTLIVGCTFAGAPETTGPQGDYNWQETELSYALSMDRAMEDYAGKNPRELTSDEIQQARDAFASTVYDETKDEYSATAVAAFFTSYYDDVRELDFAEFLRYFPASGEATEEEFQLLRQKYGEKFDFFEHETLQDMPVPVHRYTGSDIDEALRRYADISFRELADTDSVYYLEETDSFYNFTSDFGPGTFHCVKGFVYDGGAILYSTNDALFLKEAGGHYSITAHLSVIRDDNGRVVTENDSFTEGGLLVYPGTQWGMSEEEVINALGIREYGIFSGMRGIHLPTATFCGYPAGIGFYFEQYNHTGAWGLTQVTVQFADREAADEVRGILSRQLGESDYWNSDSTACLWQSDVKLEDMISPEAWALYQEQQEENPLTGGAASTIAWYGSDLETKNTLWLRSNLHLARQIEASLTPEFGTIAYFDALLNPKMYRSEADWYPRALTSFYENAGQVDLFQLFHNGIPGGDNSITDAERAFLESCPGYDPELPLMRIPADEMDRVMQEYFGTSLDRVGGIGLENFLYWEQTDCYYHCHSDTNLSFVEIVGSTELEDGLWNVTYTDWEGRLCVAALVYRNGTWKVLSNTLAEAIRPADPADQVRALFAEGGDRWYLAALAAPFSQALVDFDAEAFFSAGQTAVELTEAEKTVVTAAYGKEALKNTVFRMSWKQVEQVLDTYIFAADGAVLNDTSFLFCPETDSYLLVKEEVPQLRVPEILSCEKLASNKVRMIYRFPGEDQWYAAVLVRGETWQVDSNLMILEKPQDARTLTAEEIQRVKDAFSPDAPLSCFLLDKYADISQMNQSKFLSYYPTGEYGDEEDFRLLKEKYPEAFEHEQTIQDMNWPIHRIRAGEVRALMEEYTLADWDDLPSGGYLHYLEQTDCYYTYYSDVGLFGLQCTSGWVYDGGAMLSTGNAVLILTEQGGNYYIQAHLPAVVAE